ncbi:MAG: porin [Muribaculaceae bacterium]|nr:porin [Muribaculaceae bacterium]
MKILRTVALSMAMLSYLAVAAADSVSLVPVPYITLRTRYEWVPADGDMRFQVRHARLGITGQICPIVDYKMEADLCDKGKMRFLDLWGRVALSRDVKVQLGNMRIPFAIGSHVAPHNYIFADRPTTDKHVGSPRNVGVKLIYTPASFPLTIEGGAFNSVANTEQGWQKRMAAAAKARIGLGDGMQLVLSCESLVPDSTRLNHLGAGTVWEAGRWHVEGEYVYRHYTNCRARAAHAYEVAANYSMPVHAGVFNRLSFQGRLDGITDHSDGKGAVDGHLRVTDPAFNRITAGSTISYVHSKFRTDFRLNYEQYMYHHGVSAPAEARSKVVAELVVHF